LSMLVMVLNVDCFKTNECWRLAISYVKMAATAAHLRLSDAFLPPRWRRRVKGLTHKLRIDAVLTRTSNE
jgi:hypothetical protein